MKIPYFIKSTGAGFAVGLITFFGITSATAAAPGQIEGGDIYRIANTTSGATFSDPQTAKACDQLQYKVRLYNPGPSPIHNVMVRGSITNNAVTQNISTITASASDANPAATNDTATLNLSSAQKLSYVAGSTQLLDQQNNVMKGLPDGLLTGSGIAIGDLADSQIEFVQFKVEVACPTQPPTPTFACTMLDVKVESGRTVKITNFTTSQSNGATFKSAVIDWGDSSTPLTTTQPVGQTHQYAADGTFTIQATAHFNVNGQDQSSGGPACAKTIVLKTEQKPPQKPPKPPQPPHQKPPNNTQNNSSSSSNSQSTSSASAEVNAAPAVEGAQTTQAPASASTTEVSSAPSELVNTGPGSLAALFGIATTIGAMSNRWFLSRKLT